MLATVACFVLVQWRKSEVALLSPVCGYADAHNFPLCTLHTCMARLLHMLAVLLCTNASIHVETLCLLRLHGM